MPKRIQSNGRNIILSKDEIILSLQNDTKQSFYDFNCQYIAMRGYISKLEQGLAQCNETVEFLKIEVSNHENLSASVTEQKNVLQEKVSKLEEENAELCKGLKKTREKVEMDNFSSYQGGVTMGDNNFQRLSNSIGSNIQKISQNVSAMSKMVNQLQTPQDSHELRNQLRHIQNYTQKLAKDTSSMLIELMKLPISDQPANKLTRDRLSDEYMTTLNAFQATQRSVAQKSKDDVKKVKAQNINIGDPFAMGSSNHQLIEMDSKQVRKQEQITMQTERELQDLEERERDIRQLETDIMDVNQIFKELGSLIHDQGAVVDSIESNVEHTSQNVEAATQELRQASNYKNKLRKKKVYLAIILTIIISIILIIIFHR